MSSSAIESNISNLDLNRRPSLPSSLTPLLEKMKKIDQGYFFTGKASLTSEFNKLHSHEFSSLLDQFFSDELESAEYSKLLTKLEELSAIADPRNLSQKAGVKIETLLLSAKRMLKTAESYLSNSKKGEGIPTYQWMLNKLVSLIDNLIISFGIKSMFETSDDERETQWKGHQLFSLSANLGLLTTGVATLFSPIVAAYVAAAAFSIFLVLSIVWPMVRPMPRTLPGNAKNITQEVLNKSINTTTKTETIEKMVNSLKTGFHVLLTGPSRVGKSFLAQVLAKKIANGQCPELEGKVIFRINVSDLVGNKNPWDTPALTNISKRMGRHKKDIILVLDEIHMAHKNKSPIANQLKTLLDTGGEFGAVIGITTEKEHKKHLKKDPAFLNRFHHILVESMNKEDTETVLSDYLQSCNVLPIISRGCPGYIFDQSQKNPKALQPYASLQTLRMCVQVTGEEQRTPLQRKISRTQAKISAINAQGLLFKGYSTEELKKIQELEKQLAALEKEYLQQAKTISKVQKARIFYSDLTKAFYQTQQKVAKIAEKNLTGKNKQLVNHLLLLKLLDQKLLEFIKDKSQEIGFKSVIDKALIDSVLESRQQEEGKSHA